ncbi:MAG TPA: pyridoxal-dependent decarboxylase [Patescibacteria group bacterium]|nr:pyridoxal-dependent decarboxylase [Patescibacteria group bacterium]
MEPEAASARAWAWPDQGQNPEKLLSEIDKAPSLYDSLPPPMCYPGTKLDLDEDILSRLAGLIKLHLNAIGTHTRSKEGEGGFEWLAQKEREAIWMISSTLGGSPDTTDGYFCGGATEANLQGMLLGREWLRRRPDPMQKGIVVFCTTHVHYSILKASKILDLGHPVWSICSRCGQQHLHYPDPSGAGVNMVGMNEYGQMLVSDLERAFRLRYAEGFRRFLIVPAVGTCAMGAIDPIEKINAFVERVHKMTQASVYLHVDAAFGGFTVPFADENLRIAFQNPWVQSVALDADKMGRLPYPSGVFLCRKDLQKIASRHVNYVQGHEDDTVPGSRSAIPALLGWYWYQKIGRRGQAEFVKKCLDARDRLAALIQQRFSTRREPPTVRCYPYSPFVNFLPLEIDFVNGMIPEHDPRFSILEPYQLRQEFFPSNPGNVLSCPKHVYKICVMPHVFPSIEKFVDDLETCTRIAAPPAEAPILLMASQ